MNFELLATDGAARRGTLTLAHGVAPTPTFMPVGTYGTVKAMSPHEQPAIGVLLCASKDDEVVEYALSRSLSPALIAEYQTQLPDKALLQAKLHEFYLQNAPDEDAEA